MSALQYLPRLFARYARKPRQKIVDGCAVLKVFKQCRNGHPRPFEYPNATDAIWIAFDARTGAPSIHGSNCKRLATPAARFLTWVIEFEAFVETFALEIKLGAIKHGMALGIDQYLRTETLEHQVFGKRIIRVLKFVREPGTARCFDAEADANAFAALGNVFLNVVGSSLGEGDRHFVS